MGQRWVDGYSADVEIYLIVDQQRYDVAQIGRGALILRNPQVVLPSTAATLVMKIDGVEEVEDVFLRDGAAGGGQLVPYF